jgi:hypothetical protein
MGKDVLSNGTWSVGFGSAIGRAVGNNGAEIRNALEQASRQVAPEALEPGTQVRYMARSGIRTGKIVAVVQGYRAGKPAPKYRILGDGDMGAVEYHLEAVLGVLG